MEFWEVNLSIVGPITIRERIIPFSQTKGEINPFNTFINIRNAGNKIGIEVGARAKTKEGAQQAAIVFVEQAMDVLTFRTDLPIVVGPPGIERNFGRSYVKQIIDESMFSEAFKSGSDFSINRRVFSHALSWYRKALVSSNPLDQVIAYWVVLEVIGSKFYDKSQGKISGDKKQITNCFNMLWGKKEFWNAVPNQPEIFNKLKKYRNNIVHGSTNVDDDYIQEMVGKLPLFNKLARRFLLDWEIKGEKIEINQKIQEEEKLKTK
jgi:hypothetical protein